MSLAVVRDLREARAPAGPGELAAFETDVLAGFVLARAAAGHATRQSLEIYSRLALADAQQRYNDVIGNFPV